MAEVYLLETDIFIEPANTETFLETGVVEYLGYRDPEADGIAGPYGGLTINKIRTGPTSSDEVKVQMFDSVVGINPDEKEGVRIILRDDDDKNVFPYEHIIMRLGSSVGDEEFTLVPINRKYGIENIVDNVKVENWFRANMNNTPTIALKCYVGSGEAEEPDLD